MQDNVHTPFCFIAFKSFWAGDTWLLLFIFLLKFGVYKFSVLQVAATEFYHLFSFKKVNLLKVVIKAMAPIFLLWVNFSIRFYWYEWLYSVTVVYFTFNEFLNFEAEIIWSFPEIQHLKLWFWRPLKICHRFNVYNSELVDNPCILIRLHLIGLLE